MDIIVREPDFAAVQPCNCADKLLQFDREDSKLKTSWQSRCKHCNFFEYFFQVPCPGLQIFLCSEARTRMMLMPYYSYFRRKRLQPIKNGGLSVMWKKKFIHSQLFRSFSLCTAHLFNSSLENLSCDLLVFCPIRCLNHLFSLWEWSCHWFIWLSSILWLWSCGPRSLGLRSLPLILASNSVWASDR